MTAGSMVKGVIISTSRPRFSGHGPEIGGGRVRLVGANLGQMSGYDHGGVGRGESAAGFEETGDADQIRPQAGELRPGRAGERAARGAGRLIRRADGIQWVPHARLND